MTHVPAIVAALALAAAGFGWWRSSQRLVRHSMYDETPIGMSPADHDRRVRRGHLFVRVLTIASWTAGGALVGWLATVYLG